MKLTKIKQYKVNKGDLLPNGTSDVRTVLSGRNPKSVSLKCNIGDVIEIRVYANRGK